MEPSHNPVGSLRILISLACFVVIVAGCKAASAILVPFLLAVFIATICGPLQFWLQKRKIPTVAAVIFIMIFLSFLALLIVSVAGSSINEFVGRIPFYQAQLKVRFIEFLNWFEQFGVELSNEAFFELFDPGVAMGLAAKTLTRLRGLLTNAVFILLTVIFILLEASSFPKKVLIASDSPEFSLDRFDQIVVNINRYLAIKSITSLATGVLVAVMLFVIGVDFYLLWGLVAFTLNYVPTIGSFLAAVPAVLLAMIQLGTYEFLLACTGYIVINFTIGSFIEPRIFGREIGLSTLVVFLSLIFWGWVFRPVGMLLSVPLTMIIKIALESSEETRWIAVFLGPVSGETQSKELDTF